MKFFLWPFSSIILSTFIIAPLLYANDETLPAKGTEYAKGGYVKIINENQKPIRLIIMPQAGDAQGGVPKEYTIDLAATRETTFTINESQVGSKIFKISASTHLMTPRGLCENLNVSNNYELTLTNDLAGTSCHARKLEIGGIEEK